MCTPSTASQSQVSAGAGVPTAARPRRHRRPAATAGRLGTIALLAALGAALGACAADLPTQQDPQLQLMFQADRVWNAVTTTPDGRVFVGFPQADRPGVQVEALDRQGHGTPYPDAAWNAGTAQGGVAHAFVLINSIRMGPDGALWLVDAGAPGLGKPAVPGAARLFRIDVGTNRITRIYDLSSVAGPKSFVDDVRFHGNLAYLTDAGQPGLIVLDLASGQARRVLDDVPSTTDTRPMFADGRLLVDKTGTQVRVHADQLELSPDGATLYYQPASGPMSRIATRWLDDASLTPAELASHVEPFADTPTTGGTAIDAAGRVYVADEDHRRILRITPDGAVSTLIADPRLIWVDAMWISSDGFLWMPAAQLNRTPGLNDGHNTVDYPVAIYRLPIGIGPSPADHR